MPLALSRDPGPTPSVGHVTGDMKRRESNETHKNFLGNMNAAIIFPSDQISCNTPGLPILVPECVELG